MTNQEAALELLYQAFHAKLGILVRTSGDVSRIQVALATARLKSGDPDLQIISVKRSPLAPQTDLMLVKRGSRVALPRRGVAELPSEEGD